MGAVLRGHDPDLGRDLAVKLLLPGQQHDPVLVSRFTEEAHIACQLQHPGIVPVYEVGRSAGATPRSRRERPWNTRERPRRPRSLLGSSHSLCQNAGYLTQPDFLTREVSGPI
jgi:serine/threonine protein kinase